MSTKQLKKIPYPTVPDMNFPYQASVIINPKYIQEINVRCTQETILFFY